MGIVLKGGGVKGLALVGALDELIKNGFKFDVFAGTSAGAIIAILAAAGYTSDDLLELLKKTDFSQFLDAGPIGRWRNLLFRGGFHSGENFKYWMRDRLRERYPQHQRIEMQDLKYRSIVFATKRGMGRFIFDSAGSRKGVDAHIAARCSMSIPIFFRPAAHEDDTIYDGGLLANFPFEYCSNNIKERQFLGLYLEPTGEKDRDPWKGFRPFRVISQVIAIYSGTDEGAILDEYRDEIVTIDPSPIKTTDFNLTENEKEFLVLRGRVAALDFLTRQGVEPRDKPEEIIEQADNKKKMVLRDRGKRRPLWPAFKWGVLVSMMLALAYLSWQFLFTWYPDSDKDSWGDPTEARFSFLNPSKEELQWVRQPGDCLDDDKEHRQAQYYEIQEMGQCGSTVDVWQGDPPVEGICKEPDGYTKTECPATLTMSKFAELALKNSETVCAGKYDKTLRYLAQYLTDRSPLSGDLQKTQNTKLPFFDKIFVQANGKLLKLERFKLPAGATKLKAGSRDKDGDAPRRVYLRNGTDGGPKFERLQAQEFVGEEVFWPLKPMHAGRELFVITHYSVAELFQRPYQDIYIEIDDYAGNVETFNLIVGGNLDDLSFIGVYYFPARVPFAFHKVGEKKTHPEKLSEDPRPELRTVFNPLIQFLASHETHDEAEYGRQLNDAWEFALEKDIWQHLQITSVSADLVVLAKGEYAGMSYDEEEIKNRVCQ